MTLLPIVLHARRFFRIAAVLFCCFPGAAGGADETPVRFRPFIEQEKQCTGAFLKDRQGFLWFGTYNDLCRFDGYEIEPLNLGLSVFCIIEGDDGMFWLATSGGLVRYSPETGQKRLFRHDPGDPDSISNDVAASVYEDRNGDIWVATEGGGLNRFSKKTETFVHFRRTPGQSGSISSDQFLRSGGGTLVEDQDGFLWAGTYGGGLNRYDPDSGVFEVHRHDPDAPESLSSDFVTVLTLDSQGNLWVGTQNGLNLFDRDSGSFKHIQFQGKGLNITSVMEDRTGGIWIGTAENGLFHWNRETGSTEVYRQELRNVTTSHIQGIYQCADTGIIWVVNNVPGVIDHYDPLFRRFRLFRHDPENPASLKSSTILPIHEDSRGTIWVGTFAGLHSLDPESNGEFDYYPLNGEDYHVGAILEDSSGTLWVGLWGRSLLMTFDRDTRAFGRRYAHVPDDPSRSPALKEKGHIRWILEDRDDPDILWFVVQLEGLKKFNKRTERFVHYVHDPQNPHSIMSGEALFIHQDRSGDLWIPSQNGLNRFDRETEKFHHYRHDPDDPASISSNMATEILPAGGGDLWIGTGNGGLNLYHRREGRFECFDKKNGFPTSAVMSMLMDGQGRLWIGTGDTGIVRFDPDSGETRIYTEKDGLQGNIFFTSSRLKARDGRMYFGGANGMNVFHPDRIPENSIPPPVYLTSLTQGGDPVKLDRTPSYVREIRIDWRAPFFEFEFAALNYTHPENNQYRYCLKGFEKRWYDSGTRRFGRYAGLPGGEYELKIIGANNDGVWNNHGASLNVIVMPPFWRTQWFLAVLLTAATVLALSIMFYVMRLTSEIHRRNEAETRLRENETRIRNILETIPHWIFEIDSGGVIRTTNSAVESIFGYRPDEVLNRSIKDILSPEYGEEDVWAHITHLIEKNTPHLPFVSRNPKRKRDGGLIFIELTGSRRVGGKSETTGLVCVLSDITDRKIAEDRMHRQSQALEQSMDGIAITDPDYRFQFVNHAWAEMHGYQVHELTGVQLSLLHEQSHLDSELLPLLEKARQKGACEGEVHHRKKDGTVFPTRMSVTRLTNDRNESIGLIMIAHDITSERKLEEQLMQAQKMESIGNLAGGVAHDFNNMLSPIIGYAELLLLDLPPGNRPYEHVNQILKAAERASELTKRLLAFGRRQVLEMKTVNMGSIISGLQKMLERILREDISLDIHLLARNSNIKADVPNIEQTLINLAVNAQDAMPDGGKLMIELDEMQFDRDYADIHPVIKPGRYVLLSVSDTGAGMDTETRKRIFEPFFTTKEKGRGTGLGLAMAYGVIRQHGGEILVYSEPGKGTTFRIILPCVNNAPETDEKPPPAPRAMGSGETILVVEDDEMVRELIVQILNMYDYQVLIAPTPGDAISIVENYGGPLDLLLTDVVMPGMNGRELHNHLVKIRPDLKALYISGYTDNIIAHHGVLNKGVHFLQKPITGSSLTTKIREVIAGES